MKKWNIVIVAAAVSVLLGGCAMGGATGDKTTQGVQAFTVKGSRTVTMVGTAEEFLGEKAPLDKFRAASLPSSGAPMKETDMKSLFDEL